MATGVGGVVMVVGYMVGSIRKIVHWDTAGMEVKGRGQGGTWWQQEVWSGER